MSILEPKAGDRFIHDKGWRNHNNPQEDGEKYNDHKFTRVIERGWKVEEVK